MKCRNEESEPIRYGMGDGFEIDARQPEEMTTMELNEIAEATDGEPAMLKAVTIAMTYMADVYDGDGVTEADIAEVTQIVQIIAALELLRRDGLLEADGPVTFDPQSKTRFKQTDLGLGVAEKMFKNYDRGAH